MDKISSQLNSQDKTLSDKMAKQINDCQKSLQEKITSQEKNIKEMTDKIGNINF